MPMTLPMGERRDQQRSTRIPQRAFRLVNQCVSAQS
jgi:hypothetical protein